MNDRLVIGDVVVTHPAAASYERAAAKTDGHAAKLAEDRKWRDFNAHGDGAGFVFVPLAIESFGRHGKQAMRFLSELGDMVAQGGGSKRAFVRQFRTELSCALVRGNARMYAHALTNVVRASGGAFQAGYDVPVSGPCCE